jgi:hypothetical protein
MTISINELRSASYRFSSTKTCTLNESRALGYKTAFLCHSHKDQELVKGLVILLQEAGWRIYIDWTDTSMPETPNRQTAANIKRRIEDHHFFLYLATSNSMSSRWCPWEIGYADGKKQIDQILIIPTSDGTRTHGNEYLQLYRRIEFSNLRKLGVWQPGDTNNGVLLENLWR